MGDDVDLDQIAQTTAGFTGADLENLMNEAAIMAAKEHRAYIVQADIQRAFVKVGIGAEKKSRIISDKEKRITAYHEAGHAILFHVLPDVGPVYSVSIIPTGIGAAGYTTVSYTHLDVYKRQHLKSAKDLQEKEEILRQAHLWSSKLPKLRSSKLVKL